MQIESPSGLRVQLNANGSIRRIDRGDIILNLFPGSEMEGGPANVYLRRHGAGIEWAPLLGPRSPAAMSFGERGFSAQGEWQGIRFQMSLRLASSAPAWLWHVALENVGPSRQTVDLVYAQDLALAHYGAVRLNEYYVSQYIDYTPLAHAERGFTLAARQNLAMGGCHPWALIGSLGRGVSFATDALQLYGLAGRAGDGPAALRDERLPGKRHQHEHSMAVLQDAPVGLEPGARILRGFFGWLEPDHPSPTSSDDLRWVDRALALPEAVWEGDAGDSRGEPPAPTLFSARPSLACRDLGEHEITALLGEDLREVEREGSRVQSFFTGASRHVALRAKELLVLRPHGQILRTGDRLVPEEASLTSTVWMGGTFHSMATQGHVSINRFLSTTHGYLGLFRSHGQRVFAELAGGWQLLDLPSAFAMTPSGARWIYEHDGGRIQVRSWAAVERHELWLSLEVLSGPPCRFLVSHHVAVHGDDGADAVPVRFVRDEGGVAVRFDEDSELGRRFPDGSFRVDPALGTRIERCGGDELLFTDGRSRSQPFLVLISEPATSAAFRITGLLVVADAPPPAAADPAADESRADGFWRAMTGALDLDPVADRPLAGDVLHLREILPWLTHDALIHHLAPRGLEQYSGGGWGTRDVCQGPLELLLSLARFEPVRDLLVRVYRNQNPDGDWPQWFMFFERERSIRPAEAHGDIVFWPLLALARYLLASEDAGILDEQIPFFDERGDAHAERTTLWGHVERALGVMAKRVVAGTWLAAYGHGDWNDSLQPADASMCERLCSAWTVTLQYQTLSTLALALRRVGRAGPAVGLEESAARVREDFQRVLLADGVLPGFVYFPVDGRMERWLHPSDASSGIHFRLLPMIHAILADLLSPAQAQAHVALIREHLLGPDGARLFDRPPRYRGGVQRQFQRAESGTFFGREIGIMYTHAHLRYAEAMAHWGDADAFFLALRQANPIGLRAVVPAARPRQTNCYTSSSDGWFADRYEAEARYAELLAGEVPLEGGWRVYSSGAGIAVHLIRECLLGVREGRSRLVIDPVLPQSLDGLRARLALASREVEIVYRVGEAGHGPTTLSLNGRALAFEREENPYRTGGAEVSMDALREQLAPGRNQLVVELR